MAEQCILTSHKSSIYQPLYHILLKTMIQPKFPRTMKKFGNSNYFTYIASYFHTSKHKQYNIIKPHFEALSGQEESEELKITTKFQVH